METSTKEITKKLRKSFVEKFVPLGEQLRYEGQSDYDIIKVFNDFVLNESMKLYRAKKYKRYYIGHIVDGILAKGADSKIELIYYDLFKGHKIPFEFQYKIGNYRADFLIDKWLVFEIDGPQHDKKKDSDRDRYMEKMGYKVFRVPAWLASASPGAVVEEVKELYRNGI